MTTAHKIASERNAERKKSMKERYDMNSVEPQYKIGDLVLHDPAKEKEYAKNCQTISLAPLRCYRRLGQ